jgi:AcrR family transcriptional regulator
VLLANNPMPAPRKSTRQRLVQAALQLFAGQGVTETTTRQIAELAAVNEVTLFRQFGSKHGLLLAVIEEAEVFTQLGETLGQQALQVQGVAESIRVYAQGYLQALNQIPEFVRSLVGEAGNYPSENRQAIGRGLGQVHRYTVQYLTLVRLREQPQLPLGVEPLASLLNDLLMGYAVTIFTTGSHPFWPDQDRFIADLVQLFAPGQPSESGVSEDSRVLEGLDVDFPPREPPVQDLPAVLVKDIFQRARRSGLQDYALVYVLFGAGLSPREMACLQRSHSLSNPQQHLLQIPVDPPRQVPLNQWIMGHRYGSYTNNPLSQWLKSRKDSQSALFINPTGLPLSVVEICQCWQEITLGMITPTGQPPQIEQAQDTWRVEMLGRGMSATHLSLLTGCPSAQLEPYLRRSQEKAALDQALRLDHRPGQSPEITG